MVTLVNNPSITQQVVNKINKKERNFKNVYHTLQLLQEDGGRGLPDKEEGKLYYPSNRFSLQEKKGQLGRAGPRQ